MDYNIRLFNSSNLRRWYHIARFNWVGRVLEKHDAPMRIIELGCYDGRVLDHINNEKLNYYHGYDANWEGGLTLAKKRVGDSRITFSECHDASNLDQSEHFNIFLSLETLEHIDQDNLKNYFSAIDKLLHDNSLLLITVPNEIGPLFFVKTILKKCLHNDSEGYTFMEFIYQSFGLTRFVHRREHKGFDWRELRKQLSAEFRCEFKAKGVQFSFLPVWCSPSIGLVGKSKK